MVSLTYRATPTEFSTPPQILDWSLDGDAVPMASNRPVARRPALYQLNGGPLTVNATGPVVRLRYCSGDDFPVNLWQGDGLLTARDPNASGLRDDTPLSIVFDAPPRGVGAFVTVNGNAVDDDLQVHALMWVLPAGSQTWASFSGDGLTGQPIAPGSPAQAAFIGVEADVAGGIAEVCFDATLKGNRNFQFLALSRLLWFA